MKKRKDLKILLLQFRVAKEMQDQEWECFVKFSELKPEQIIQHYILNSEFDLNSLKEYDGIIVGGTGDFEVHTIKREFPKAYKQLLEINNYVNKINLPLLASCLQIWAEINGGTVGTLDAQELGVYDIKLTDNAKKDELFKDQPKEFKALLGHKDYVSKLPENSVLLAYSKTCPTEAFRIGKNQYFLQFHAELDREKIIERIDFYNKRYAPQNPEEFNELINSLIDTPEATQILKRFIDLVVLENSSRQKLF